VFASRDLLDGVALLYMVNGKPLISLYRIFSKFSIE